MPQCPKQALALFKDGGAFSSRIRIEGISWSISTRGITISSSVLITPFVLWSVCCNKGTEKSPGPYCIPAELLKERGYLCTRAIHQFITLVWQLKNIPNSVRMQILSQVIKTRATGPSVKIVGGSHSFQLQAKVMLHRLVNTISENILPESQSGFRAGRSTVDMIFTHASWKRNVTNNTRTCSLLLWIFPRLLILYITISYGKCYCILKAL